MKIANIFLIIIALCISCRDSKETKSNWEGETTKNKELDSTKIEFSWNENQNIRPIESELNYVLEDHFKSELEPLILKESTILNEMNSIENYIAQAKLSSKTEIDAWSTVFTEEFYIDFDDNDCWENRPKTIYDLTDGVLIDIYSFEKGDEKKLDLLGFFNVGFKKNQQALVVEFSQEGTQFCLDKKKKYGVGARLMLHITKVKRNAKLNTPQQITASMIYGFAEVKFSLRTFGIVGPGISDLNNAGSLSEDTYQQFLQKISELIKDMYSENKRFIVTPQPLLLKNSVD